MTEKENKAIEDYKRVIAMYFKYSNYDLFCSNLMKSGVKGTIQNTMADMVNLIEKLQKENEELKNTKNNCPQFNTSGVSCKLKQGDYIPKDKIRDKLDEIMSYTFTSIEERHQQNYAYDRIRELLEEE